MDFSRELSRWYDENKRELPWRETVDPYRIWLSEIILQQTQIIQGLPYYLKFIETFPTVFDLAEASENKILNLWQGLGYYSRARNLHETAKFVANDLNGKFPDNYNDLIKLKGVGDYTASAIASICFNQVTPVLDGNVFRFLSRYFGIQTPINSSRAKNEFKQLAHSLIDSGNPAKFNQSIMEFGAKQCKPQNPDCTACPFNFKCIALEKGLVKKLPIKLKKNKIKDRYFNFLVFLSDDGQTILQQRLGKGIWKNLYQFPLVETSKDVTLLSLKKTDEFQEILKGFDYDIFLFNETNWLHKLSHQHLYTKFWVITLKQLPVEGIPIKTIKNYPVPVLIDNFINTFKF